MKRKREKTIHYSGLECAQVQNIQIQYDVKWLAPSIITLMLNGESVLNAKTSFLLNRENMK